MIGQELGNPGQASLQGGDAGVVFPVLFLPQMGPGADRVADGAAKQRGHRLPEAPREQSWKERVEVGAGAAGGHAGDVFPNDIFPGLAVGDTCIGMFAEGRDLVLELARMEPIVAVDIRIRHEPRHGPVRGPHRDRRWLAAPPAPGRDERRPVPDRLRAWNRWNHHQQ